MEGARLDLALRTSSPLPAGTGSDPALFGMDLHGSGTVADPVWTGEITVRNLNVQVSRTPAYLPYATFRLGKNGATLSTCDLYAVTRGGMERFVLTGSSTVATIHPPVPALEDLLLGDGVRRDMVPGRRRGIVPSPSGLYEADGTARLAFAPWWVRSLCLGTETFSRPGAAGFSDLLEPVPMDGGLPGFTGSWTITQPIPERKP